MWVSLVGRAVSLLGFQRAAAHAIYQLSSHMISTSISKSAAAFFTNEAVAVRWDCSTETVRRTSRRERWTTYRMGGRVARFLVEEVLAYEARCRQAGPRHETLPPRKPTTNAS